MSEQRRTLVAHLYDALNRRDFAAFVEGVHPDVEFRSLIAETEGETFRGHEGVKSWWVQVQQSLGGLGYDVEEYAEEGDGLVIKIRVRGNVGTTGIEQTMWQGVVLRDGKAVWWQPFRSEEEAWAAVRERLAR
jgi:ketosteroid isomerase-like protein